MRLPIKDRTTAGKALAAALSKYKGRQDLIVLALPRGGVPVAYEIAQALSAKLDIMIVRKLGVPRHSELAMGAIASGGIKVWNTNVLRYQNISQADIENIIKIEEAELKRRERTYRGDRPWPVLKNQRVILVDDGIATGATMRAAVDAVRQQEAEEIIIAVPVAPPDTLTELICIAHDVVCLATPEPFYAIGQWYENFDQTLDQEVLNLLTNAWIQEESQKDAMTTAQVH